MSLVDEYKRLVRGLFNNPGTRVIIEEALKSLDEDLEGKPFYVIRAPTGYGKTTFSYTLALHALKDNSRFEKVIHVLPFRAIIEDAYHKSSFLFPFVGRQMMGVHESPFLLKALTFTTVDTFIYDLMKLNTMKSSAIREGREYGYDYFTQAGIVLSAIVFDEAHVALEGEMASAFLTALEVLMHLGTPIFILTATISENYSKRLRRRAEERGYIYRVFPEFGQQVNDDFFKREEAKQINISVADGFDLVNLVSGDKRYLIVVNTVKRAQEIYSRLRSQLKERDILLIHSRFTPSDRRAKISKLESLKNKESWVVVSTQVIEAGVDISSDVLITELAPPTSLIQRMGRNARFDEKSGEIHIILSEKCPPYPDDLCERTRNWLKEKYQKLKPRDPSTYQGLLNEVYQVLKGRRYPDLLTFMLDPLVRSDEMSSYIRNLSGRNFLREYPIQLFVGKEAVPVTPYILRELIRRGAKISCGEKCKLTEGNLQNVVERIANWEDIKLTLENQDFYDKELGLRW